MKFCEECGAQLDDNAMFCEECGTQFSKPINATHNTANHVEKNIVSSVSKTKKTINKLYFLFLGTIIFLVIVIIVLIVLLCSDSTTNSDTDSTSSAETTQQLETSSSSETEKDTTEDSGNSEDSKSNITVYESIPDAYYSLISNIYVAIQTDDFSSPYYSIGISEITMYQSSDNDKLKSISYCIADVNNDSSPELFITETPYQEAQSMRILDMYTSINGTTTKVVEGWARNRYFLLSDGTIYNVGSNGAAYSINEIFLLEPGKSALTSKGLYFTDEGYYYSETGEYDITKSVEITLEKYLDFINTCEKNILTLDTKSFDTFQ